MKLGKSQEKIFFDFSVQEKLVKDFMQKNKNLDSKKIVSSFAKTMKEGFSFIWSFVDKITEDLTFHKDGNITVDTYAANSILKFVKKNIVLNAYSHQILNNKKVTQELLKQELTDWFQQNEKAGKFVLKFIK